MKVASSRRRSCLLLQLAWGDGRLRGGRVACTFNLEVTDDMKFAKRRFLCLMLVSLCLACYARAQSRAPQADVKTFVTEYVAAFDAKDAARLQALYESKSRACIAAEDKEFYDFSLAVMWQDTIPPKYTFTVSAVNENNLKAIETFGWFPLKPTHELHIDYQQGDDSGTVIVYLVRENGRWLADQPCATEQTVKQFRDGAPARKAAEAHYKALARAIREPLRSQLVALLREHKTGDAIERYKKASGTDGQTAMLVIDQLALEARH